MIYRLLVNVLVLSTCILAVPPVTYASLEMMRAISISVIGTIMS